MKKKDKKELLKLVEPYCFDYAIESDVIKVQLLWEHGETPSISIMPITFIGIHVLDNLVEKIVESEEYVNFQNRILRICDILDEHCIENVDAYVAALKEKKLKKKGIKLEN
jgi:hypothetical protein